MIFRPGKTVYVNPVTARFFNITKKLAIDKKYTIHSVEHAGDWIIVIFEYFDNANRVWYTEKVMHNTWSEHQAFVSELSYGEILRGVLFLANKFKDDRDATEFLEDCFLKYSKEKGW